MENLFSLQNLYHNIESATIILESANKINHAGKMKSQPTESKKTYLDYNIFKYLYPQMAIKNV